METANSRGAKAACLATSLEDWVYHRGPGAGLDRGFASSVEYPSYNFI
jgi:hypothetical protein